MLSIISQKHDKNISLYCNSGLAVVKKEKQLMVRNDFLKNLKKIFKNQSLEIVI